MPRRSRRSSAINERNRQNYLDALRRSASHEIDLDHAIDTPRGRIGSILLGAALQSDPQVRRHLCERALAPDPKAESARRRTDATRRTLHQATIRCMGADDVVRSFNRCLVVVEHAINAIDAEHHPGAWRHFARSAQIALSGIRSASMAERTVRDALLEAGLPRKADTTTRAPGATQCADAFTRLWQGVQSGTDARGGDPTHWIRLREACADALRSHCIERTVPRTTNHAPLHPFLAEGLDAATRLDARTAIAAIAGRFRAEDDAIVAIFTGTYPYDPANPVFSRPRGTRKGANPCTEAWIDTNPVIVPVVIDRNARLLGDHPTAQLLRTYLARDPGPVLDRIAIAGWDAHRGSVMVRQPQRTEQGIVLAGDLLDKATRRADDPVKIPVALGTAAEPEDWAGPPAEPGKPVFVLIREEEIVTTAQADGEDHRSLIVPFRNGRHKPQGVHAQTLAITAATRLAGARNVAVLTAESVQGYLFKPSELRRGGVRQSLTLNPPIISLPVHRAVLNALAMGGGIVDACWHPGAPQSADTPIETQAARFAKIVGTDLADPVLYDATAKRPTTLGIYVAWRDTLERRIADFTRRDPLEPGAPNRVQGAAIRIGVLAQPDAFASILDLVRDTYPDRPVEILLPEHQLSDTDTARTLRNALRAVYPQGQRDILDGPSDPIIDPQGAIRPAHAKEFADASCRLILLGDLEPARPGDRPLLDILSETARHATELPATVVASTGDATPPLASVRDAALLWADHEAYKNANIRRARGNAPYRAHPDTARRLLAQHPSTFNAVAVTGHLAHVRIPGETDTDERWAQAAQALRNAATAPCGHLEGVSRERLSIDEMTLRVNPHDLSDPPHSGPMRLAARQRKPAALAARAH